MKKINTLLLFLLLTASVNTFAQKKTSSDYNTLEVSYVRLPLKPLDPSIKTYHSVVKVVGGDIRDEPAELAKDFLRIAGLERVTENQDLLVKVVLKGFQVNSKRVMSRGALVSGAVPGAGTQIQSLYPARLEIYDKAGKEILVEDVSGFSQIYSYETPTMSSPAAAEKDYDDNSKEYKRKAEQAISAIVFAKIKDKLEGFYVKAAVKRSFNVGFAEGKGHNFDDITTAKGKIISALTDFNMESFADANTKFDLAIGIYKKALSETNLTEDKARISKKVAAMIHYNVALCHTFKNEFADAEKAIDECITITKTIKSGGIFSTGDKTGEIAEPLRVFILEQKARFEKNKK